jgi:uncharacterized membrane protein
MSSDSEVWRQFLELTGRFSTYTLSFIVLGTFWIDHHLLFHFVRKVNPGSALVKSPFLVVHHPVPFSINLLSAQSDLEILIVVMESMLLISITSLCN